MCKHVFVIQEELNKPARSYDQELLLPDSEFGQDEPGVDSNSKKESVQNKKQHHKYSSPKKKSIAIRLCAFFGMFGAHHFYTGHYILAIIYLLTFGVFTFGWMFDFVRIALGKYKDVNGNYIQ